MYSSTVEQIIGPNVNGSTNSVSRIVRLLLRYYLELASIKLLIHTILISEQYYLFRILVDLKVILIIEILHLSACSWPLKNIWHKLLLLFTLVLLIPILFIRLLHYLFDFLFRFFISSFATCCLHLDPFLGGSLVLSYHLLLHTVFLFNVDPLSMTHVFL